MKWATLLPLLFALAAIAAVGALLNMFTPTRRRRDGSTRGTTGVRTRD